MVFKGSESNFCPEMKRDFFSNYLSSGVRNWCLNKFFLEANFFETRQIDFCFCVSSLEVLCFFYCAITMIHRCSSFAYLKVLEFINGQLRLLSLWHYLLSLIAAQR